MKERYLFRAKRIDNGEWAVGSLLQGNVYCIYAQEYMDNYNGEPSIFPRIDKDTIGQCTGLRDRAEKLIYEGDILETVALSNDHFQKGARAIFHVGYWNGAFQMMYLKEQTACGIHFWDFIVDHEILVIGDIYNTPELLEARP